MASKKIKASVIIPVYNEEKEIYNCLKSLSEQSYKNFEIIIVDDGSTDNSIEITKNFKGIKTLEQDHKGPGSARNFGAKKSTGEILVFVDSDMVFDKDYLNNLLTPIIQDRKIIGTTHELEIVKNTENIWSRCWGKVRISKEKANEVKIFRAIRKKDFLKFGGFDSSYGYADDQTFWFKYSIKPVVAKNTICYHKNPETLKSVYKQSKWIGASINNSLLKLPIFKYLVPFVLIITSPVIIFILSIIRCMKIKEFRIFFPWMFIFVTFRYFGTVRGIFNRIYLGKNAR
ncbi:MAG: glycosyltransferase family A protein [Nanoarchaeota archaeon]